MGPVAAVAWADIRFVGRHTLKKGGVARNRGVGYSEVVDFSRAPVAQLDRASGYEPEGRMFESCRAHHVFNNLTRQRSLFAYPKTYSRQDSLWPFCGGDGSVSVKL